MLNFDFCCPTRVVFGKDSVKNLKNLLPKKAKILLTYGGGSIKKNGAYDDAMSQLKDYEVVEFSGIEPNPHYDTCIKASEICKKENIDFILAVGGGSVLDASKFIAAAAKYNGDDAWKDLVEDKKPVNDALSLASVMTLPATGSEMNCGAVISNKEKQMKQAFINPIVFPKFSIIDPSYTFSLPKRQLINGIVDTFVHTMEQFCNPDVNTPIQDGFSIAILKTLINESDKILNQTDNYEARANFCWAATTGLNGWISVGVMQDWGTHKIGHELTEIYGLDHGATLAIVLPRELKAKLSEKKTKLEIIAKEVFNLSGDNLAIRSIDEIEKFFVSIGAKVRLSDFDIDAKEAGLKVKQNLEKNADVGIDLGNITPDEAYEIVSNS